MADAPLIRISGAGGGREGDAQRLVGRPGCPPMAPGVTLAALQDRVARFVAARAWERFHNPKDLALALSVEASELLEVFQWRSEAEVADRLEELKPAIADELADVVIYGLSLANALSLDLGDAVVRKLEKNADRFPPEEVRGRAPE